jgi:hypothetical protein
VESVAVLFLRETEHGELLCHMTEELSRVGKRGCKSVRCLLSYPWVIGYLLKCLSTELMSFSIKMVRIFMALSP